MTEHTIRDHELAIGDECVQFPISIAETVGFDDFVVVRLKTTGEDHPDKYQNVIAVDSDGSIRWKIPEQPPSKPRPYTSVYTTESELWAYNFSGHRHQVDPETGELLDREFVK